MKGSKICPSFQMNYPFKSFVKYRFSVLGFKSPPRVIYSKIDKVDANLGEHNHSNLLQLERKMCKRRVNNLGNNLGCITGENTNPNPI